MSKLTEGHGEEITHTPDIRGAALDFQQFHILTSVDSEEPLQPPFKHKNSKWYSVSSFTIIDYSSD